jgi:hypothetical protein
MRKRLLIAALSLSVISVFAGDASACFWRWRCRKAAPCYCRRLVYSCPASPARPTGQAGAASAAPSVADLLKVLEPAKPPEVPADIAKLLGLKLGETEKS